MGSKRAVEEGGGPADEDPPGGADGASPAEPGGTPKRSRLSVRQMEVLIRIRQTGTTGPPEEGRKVGLTVRSLVRRRLIRPHQAPDRPEALRYELTEEGEGLFPPALPPPETSLAVDAAEGVDLDQAEAAEGVEPDRAGAGGGVLAPESCEGYVPKIGDWVRVRGSHPRVTGCIAEILQTGRAILCSPVAGTWERRGEFDCDNLCPDGDPVPGCRC